MQPQQIPSQKIPLLSGQWTPYTGSLTDPVVADSGALTPPTITNQVVPNPIVAQEVASSSLDTERKKIMAAYQFEQLGALRVGEFSAGVSGELDISQDGLTAKNKDGVITFFIDGSTGNATFVGTVSAGAFDVVDNLGLVSLNAFSSGDAAVSAQDITATSLTDLSSLSLTTSSFPRSAKVLIFFEAQMKIDASDGVSAFTGGATLEFNVDSAIPSDTPIILENAIRAAAYTDNCQTHYVSMTYLTTLGTGTHTIKVQGLVTNGSGSGKLSLLGTGGHLSYVILGN